MKYLIIFFLINLIIQSNSIHAQNQKDSIEQKRLDPFLLFAVKSSDFENVRKLVEQGANVNAFDSTKATVLMWAALKCDLEVVKYLVSKGADIKQKGILQIDSDIYGNLLGIATGNNKIDMLKYFIEELKLNVDDPELTSSGKEDGWTPLLWASFKGQLEAAEYVISKGADVNYKDGDNQTALYFVGKYSKNKSFFDLLHAKGAKANIFQYLEIGYIDLAITDFFENSKRYYQSDTISLILGKAIDFETYRFIDTIAKINPKLLDSCIIYENNTLNTSILNNNLELTKLCISNYCDLNRLNKDGYSPLDVAQIKEYNEISEILKANGAKNFKEFKEIIPLNEKSDSLSGSKLIVPTGHTIQIESITKSNDDKYLLSIDNSKLIIWDKNSGKELKSIEGKFNGEFVISNNNQFIAIGMEDQSIQIFDLIKDKFKLKISIYDESLIPIAFNDHNDLITITRYTGIINFWDIRNNSKLRKIKCQVDENKLSGLAGFIQDKIELSSVSISPDKNLIIYGYKKGKIKLINPNSNDIHDYNVCTSRINSIAFKNNMSEIALGCQDGKVIIWDFKKNSISNTFLSKNSNVSHIKLNMNLLFSSDDEFLICSDNQITSIYRTKNWELINSFNYTNISDSYFFENEGNGIISIQFYLDFKNIFCLFTDKNSLLIINNKDLKLVNIKDNNIIEKYIGHSIRLKTIAVDKKSNYLCYSNGNYFNLFNMQNSANLYLNQFKKVYGENDIIFDSNSKSINIAHFNPKQSEYCYSKYYIQNNITDLIFNSNYLKGVDSSLINKDKICITNDNKYIISYPDNSSLYYIFDFATGKKLFDYKVFNTKYRIFPIKLGFENKYLIEGSTEVGKIKLWNINTNYEIFSMGYGILDGLGGDLRDYDIHPKEKKFVISSHHIIKSFDIKTKNVLKAWNNDNDCRVKYSSDGRYLYISDEHGDIEVIDDSSGNLISHLQSHNSYISSIIESYDNKFIFTSSYDGTIKVWNITDWKNIATLIPLDSTDWAVVTPDGRFDASEGGMKMMYYVQGLKPIALEAFYEKYYTPGLLQKVLAGTLDSLREKSVDFTKEIKLPPQIKLISPQNNDKIDKDLILIKAQFSDLGNGIDEIRLYQNGKLIENSKDKKKSEDNEEITINKKFSVNLLPGKNEFKITAFNLDRTESSEEFNLFYETGNKDVLLQMPSLYVISVGINKYKNSVYDLNYCRPDAEAFSKQLNLHSRKIFKDIKIFEFYDDHATKEEIEIAFKYVSDSAKPIDCFVFYYAGHGITLDDDKGNLTNYYIVLHDITSVYGIGSKIKEKGISSDHLKDLCQKIKALKQLLLMDACNSDAALKDFASRGFSEEKAIKQLARSAGVVVIASAGSDQKAIEFDKLGHGVFTYALLKGLDGEADSGKQPDGKVTVYELRAYLDDKVPELTEKYKGKRQYPQGSAEGQDFPLVIVK